MKASWLIAALFACGTRTEIIVELDTDIAELDHYEVAVSGNGEERIDDLPRSIGGELPSFGVAPLAGEIARSVTLEIIGRNADDEELERTTRVISGFVKNQRKKVGICVAADSAFDGATLMPGDPNETCGRSNDGGVDGGTDASTDGGDAGIDAGDAGDEDATATDDGGLPDGTLLLHLGGPNDDTAGDVAVDSAGNIIVVGTFENMIELEPGEMLTGGTDGFVVKYDRGGIFLWAHSINTSAGVIEATSVAINSQDQIFVGGSFENQLGYDGAVLIDSPGPARGFILRIEPGGLMSGHLVVEAVGAAKVSDVAIGGNDDVFAGGEYYGRGAASAGCVLEEFDGNTPTDRDGFIIAAASNLTCTWAQVIGSAFDEEVSAVAATADTVYAAGSFDSVVAVTPTPLASANFGGGRAAMVVALTVDRAPLGLMALGHADAPAEGLAIAATASSIFVGGSFADSPLQVDISLPDGKDISLTPADDQILFAHFPPDLSPVNVVETTSTMTLTLRAMTAPSEGVVAAGHLAGELELDDRYTPVGRGAFLLTAPLSRPPSGLLADSTGDEELVGVDVDSFGRTVVLGMFGPVIVLPGAGLTTRGGSDIFVYAF